MNDTLQIPAFARLDDYVGLWLCEPSRLAAMWQLSQRLDFRAHAAEWQAKEPVAAIEKMPIAGGKSVAVVKLTGLLMKSATSIGGTSTIQARRDLRQAATDPDVSGIVLAIDSPGGTVAGTSDLAAEVTAARKQKPVVAQIEDLGASAAYWIASQADAIFVNSPTALVGSIGTLQVIQDLSGAAAAQGIRTLVFGTGPFKGLGTPGAPVTEEQVAHVQALVDSVQGSFDAAVKKGRGLNDKQLLAVRHGGVFSANDAMSNGLIDGIQPIAKTIAELSKAGVSRGSPKAESGLSATAIFPMLRRSLPMLSKQEL
jgi:signal peptide peptidase SppA